MSRLKKLFNKVKDTKTGSVDNGNVFKVDGYKLEDLINFLNEPGNDSMDPELKTEIATHLIVTAVIICIMAQIRLNSKESNQFVDGLMSFKFYKRKFISDLPGRTWCTLIPLYEAIDKLKLSILEIFENYFGEAIKPHKVINGQPTENNATDYFLYRRTVILGLLQACPATKLKFFNLNVDTLNWNLEDALKFICPNGLPFNITTELIRTTILQTVIDPRNGGILTFDEPSTIMSKIEKEIFEDKLVRNGQISTRIQTNGELPSNRLTLEQIETLLNPTQIRSYKVALRFGDTKTLRQLNDLASELSIQQAVQNNPPSNIDPPPEPPKAGRKRGL